ncbi:PSMD4 isoform 10, partial [Pan troglodytes]
QEEEARRAAAASAAEAGIATTGTEGERGGIRSPGTAGC